MYDNALVMQEINKVKIIVKFFCQFVNFTYLCVVLYLHIVIFTIHIKIYISCHIRKNKT